MFFARNRESEASRAKRRRVALLDLGTLVQTPRTTKNHDCKNTRVTMRVFRVDEEDLTELRGLRERSRRATRRERVEGSLKSEPKEQKQREISVEISRKL